jgi:hypothetical protein
MSGTGLALRVGLRKQKMLVLKYGFTFFFILVPTLDRMHLIYSIITEVVSIDGKLTDKNSHNK